MKHPTPTEDELLQYSAVNMSTDDESMSSTKDEIINDAPIAVQQHKVVKESIIQDTPVIMDPMDPMDTSETIETSIDPMGPTRSIKSMETQHNSPESTSSNKTEFYDAQPTIETLKKHSMHSMLAQPITSSDSNIAALEILITTSDEFSPMELIGYVSLVCILLDEMTSNYFKKTKETNYLFWQQKNQENLAFVSCDAWADKIRQKLFKHLNIGKEERHMIKQMTTHDVNATDIADSIIPKDIKDKIIWERDVAYQQSKLDMMQEKDDIDELQEKDENKYYQQLNEQQQQTSDSESDQSVHCTTPPSNLYNPSLRKDLQNITEYIEPQDTDIRHIMLTDLFLTLISDYSYDARSRALLFRLARLLSVAKSDVLWIERIVAHKLKYMAALDDNKEYSQQDLLDREQQNKTSRYVAIGLASLAGGITIGVSGGIATPLLLAGLAKIGLSAGGASAFLGSTAGGIAVGSGTGLVGSIMGANGMMRRTKNITQFECYTVLHEQQVSLTISIGGWLSVGDNDDSDIALPFFPLAPEEGDHVSIIWESTMLRELGSIFKILASEVISSTVQQALALTMMSSFVAFLAWPIALSKLGYLIDNPWSNALDRAEKAGYLLADKLIRQFQDGRPISLVGYSLGARVIYFCLTELLKNHAFGIVENVYLVGCPVTANKAQWEKVSSVVSGRFVNGYARNDWILGYLFRATSGGLYSVAGLGGIALEGIQNVDISDIVDGHMAYRVNMPRIMKRLGLSVTNDQLSLVYKKDKAFRDSRHVTTDLTDIDHVNEKIKNIVNEAAEKENVLEVELAKK